MTAERWAEFIGFQKDERIGGVRPFFVLHAPDSDRDGSTVFTETVQAFGIPIPEIPHYEPETFKDCWMPKCEDCHITWFSVAPACDHVRANKDHHMVHYRVPVVKNISFKQSPSQVWVRDDEKNELILEGTIMDEGDTQPLDMEEIHKQEPFVEKEEIITIPVPEPEVLPEIEEETEESDFIKEIRRRYPFLRG
ncbi:MAG: hypothetical protein V3U54_07875 [Thermodesulfobacteriota bacterium]